MSSNGFGPLYVPAPLSSCPALFPGKDTTIWPVLSTQEGLPYTLTLDVRLGESFVYLAAAVNSDKHMGVVVLVQDVLATGVLPADGECVLECPHAATLILRGNGSRAHARHKCRQSTKKSKCAGHIACKKRSENDFGTAGQA